MLVRRALLSAGGMLLLACGLAGCAGESPDVEQAEAERFVRAELLDEYKDGEDGGGPWTLGEVSCSHDQGSQFSCSASASRSPSPNELEMSMALLGVICATDHCGWAPDRMPATKPWPGFARLYAASAQKRPSGWAPYAPIDNGSG